MDLNTIAIISIIISLVCFLIIVIDILTGRRQSMGVMNFVWPITCLYSGPVGLLIYFMIGRADKMSLQKKPMDMNSMKGMQSVDPKHPGWKAITKSTLHCGSGCTIGDLISENILAVFPVFFLGSRLYGAWVVDFFFAVIIGIIFQYFALKPMKNLPVKETLKLAAKADILSLSSWQIGMYGWMAICVFVIFGRMLSASEPLFWFMMQIAMICGFFTAYPMNIFLIKKGIKEAMS